MGERSGCGRGGKGPGREGQFSKEPPLGVLGSSSLQFLFPYLPRCPVPPGGGGTAGRDSLRWTQGAGAGQGELGGRVALGAARIRGLWDCGSQPGSRPPETQGQEKATSGYVRPPPPTPPLCPTHASTFAHSWHLQNAMEDRTIGPAVGLWLLCPQCLTGAGKQGLPGQHLLVV